MNNKYIKYIIILIIIIVVVLFFVLNNNKKISTNTTQTPSNQNNTVILNNTNISTKNIDENTKIVNTEFPQLGNEDIIYEKIRKNLSDWEIIKDEDLLKTSLGLSAGADNEIILEAWVDFLKKYPEELPKLINTNTNRDKIKKEIFDIYDWYINLSVQYEKLSSTQKQIILNQYKLLK